MSTAQRARPSPRSDFLRAAFFFVFFVVVLAVGTEDMPLLADNQHYFFIAERAASGVPPHVSQFDPKNALGMLLTAGAIVIGRGVGVDDLTASRVVSVAAGALAIALMWPLARAITGRRTAAWIAVLGMLSLERFAVMSAMGSQPKIFLVAFLEMSLLAMSRGRTVLAGASASAAFLCWQPAVALLVAGPVALVLARAGLRKVVGFTCAALVPLLVYESYFLYHGALVDQIEQALVFPARYMDSFPASLRPVLRRAGWTFAVSQGVSLGSIVPLAALAALGVFWAQIWRPSSGVARALSRRADRIYIVLVAHVALISCLVSFQGFPDRFWLDPLMAIVAGWLFATIADRLSTRAPAVPWHKLTRAACMGALIVLAVTGRWDFRALNGLGGQRRAAAALSRILEAGYSVYAVGCTHLLAFNHANNFSSYGFFFRGVEEYLYAKTHGRGYVPLHDGKLPDVILVSRGTYLSEQPWFEREYMRSKREEFGAQAVQVWFHVRRGPGDFNPDSRAPVGASP